MTCVLELGNHNDRIESLKAEDGSLKARVRVSCDNVPTYYVDGGALEPMQQLNSNSKAKLAAAIKEGVKDNLIDWGTVEHFRIRGIPPKR